MPETKAELARLEEQQISAARLFNQNLDGLKKRVDKVEQAVLELAAAVRVHSHPASSE